MPVEFQIKRNDFSSHRIVHRDDAPLKDGEIRLKIDQFAFTANNMTYGVAGYSHGYWQFFPASDNGDESWGVLPVWGFADVVESRHAEVPEGERLYGYFPPSDELVMQPGKVTEQSVTEGAAHRQALPPLYNFYSRVLAEPGYDRANDAARSLLGPLHMTSFALWDQLKENGYYQAEQIIIVSASSKTSLGLAHGLANDRHAPEIIGLTSPRNVEFVKQTGLYGTVRSYDEIASALSQRPSVVVDMAGNADVRTALYQRLGSGMRYYISVGFTHWEDVAMELPAGADPDAHENFFAPLYIMGRMKELSPAEWDKRSGPFLRAAATASFGWMTVDERNGLEKLAQIYPAVCDGSLSPDIGVIIDM